MHNLMTTSARATAAAFIGALAFAAASKPAGAHHSFAMYDQTKSVTLTGKLTRFIPGANHAQLIFELVGPDGGPVLDESGKATVWGVETGPAGTIARQGVTVEGFPLGTVLSVTLNPLRNGKTFGVLDGAVVRCGMELPEGGCTAETGEVFLGDED
jgi:hypothetical protein